MMQQFRMEHEDADSAAKEMQQCTKTTTGRKQAPEQQKSWPNTLAGWQQQGLHPSGRWMRSLSLLSPELRTRANLQVHPSAERINILQAGAWSNHHYIQTAQYRWSDFKDGEWFWVLPPSEDFLGGCLVLLRIRPLQHRGLSAVLRKLF